ncbi:DNA polymerase III subunit alpha [Streptococcus ictaluri]|uniref:DNA polymerase III subunit alpha n=1 Tax=Streptococcus ictaluri 707-05 TaxID=764299 RepID=G5K2Q9_9STRE|nr:DNA polymerase III subunit alpha [Streptococcus ictaluri]EHI69926.1 DNA polymerase III, alpha subunit [Streptococcus ictaluri 707-05]
MFAQLDTKTVYSFLDSLVDLENYINQAKLLGYQSIGIMDKDNLYGAFHFIRACHNKGLKPVLGLDLTLDWFDQSYDFRLIAKTNTGYTNLLKVSTEKMSGTLTSDKFLQLLEGIALILAPQQYTDELRFPFDFYIGIDEKGVPLGNVDLSKVIPLPTVRYFSEQETETLQVLHAIRDNVTLSETALVPNGQSLKSCQEMTDYFEQLCPQSLINLSLLISAISYDFDTDLKLPRFNRDKSAKEELRQRTQEGLEKRNLWREPYQSRLNHELSVISEMGFEDYFLIVWDLVRFGRSKGYYMGMGRGSAAGSLVAFALQITGIDPVANNLLFERFLNKERYSMPDIDIDMPDIYRTEFLHYVRNRYGSQHSAQIVTFSTFGPKQAIRDVFKRFGVPEYELSHLTKKIGFRDTLDSVYEKNMAFRQVITSRLEYQKAFEMARRIEGKPRQTSIHAAGIVMSDDNLTDHIPLKNGEDMMITQYDAQAVEANGLLKMDFLGLRNLTFVQKMQEKVAIDYGISIDISAIDLEDSETLQLFARGDTKGIFQFEQNGAISLLKRIKPVKFEEIVATTSLNRPGASDYTNNFIKRRRGLEKIDLIDPIVAPILEPTYGIMLYQEQVMQIAQVYAGFSLGKADLLRRAMSKKNAFEMKKMEEDFLAGARKLGRKEEVSQLLFKRMEKFAGYGFNRSHAFAYSALAFQLAYFKTHYPEDFFDIMMNYSSSDYITDALESDFQIGSLSLNTIPFTDKIAKNTIYMGLKNVKGLPRDFAYWIIENRPFKSIEDFLTRTPLKYQKASFIEPLVNIGLFDNFEKNRKKIIGNLEELLVFVNELGSLFADSSFNWSEVEDYSPTEKYYLEQELLGVGVSKHPLTAIAERNKDSFTPIVKLVKDSQAKVLVQLETIKIIRTKTSGQQMAFLTVNDTKKKLEVTLFPEQFSLMKSLLKEGELYYISGRVKERDGRLQLVGQEVTLANQKKLWLLVKNHQFDQELSQVLGDFPGDSQVVIHYQEEKETIEINNLKVSVTPELEEKLQSYVLKTVFR